MQQAICHLYEGTGDSIYYHKGDSVTVNYYLSRVEHLMLRSERKYERYMRISAKISSPRSSLDTDGMPHGSSGNTRERQLLESSLVLDEYIAANNEYESYRDEVLSNLKRLEYKQRAALEEIYVWRLDCEVSKRGAGLCRLLNVSKHELSQVIKSAKEELKQILIEQGMDIE